MQDENMDKISLYKNNIEILRIENGLYYKGIENDVYCIEISKEEFKKEFENYFKYGKEYLNKKQLKLYSEIIKELNR